MERSVLFPGSFDPFTIGHASIVERSLKIFDKVIIAIGYNPDKKSFLSVDERVTMISDMYYTNDKVEIIAYDGLTIDIAEKLNVVAIVRGVRSTIDYEYEKTIAAFNKSINPTIDTIIFSDDLSLPVSSSMVRELFKHKRSFTHLVPYPIFNFLYKRECEREK